VFTANGAARDYGDANPALSGSFSGFKNGQTAADFGGDIWTTLATQTSNVGNYAITGGLTTAAPNYVITQAAGNATALTVNPATLTYVADPASRVSGFPNPVFTGTVTGFVLGETLGTATTGTLLFTSLADASSPPGTYAINGSGLSAVNYVFVQAPRNATALTINQQPSNPTSRVNPPSNNPPNPGVNITFQNTISGPINISFTPPVHVASNPPAGKEKDVKPAALPDGHALATNNGFVYLPISQFDANQYSQFKLQAGEAAVFTMIARGADAQHAADDLIDTF
jgi:MBG domain (YGX type)